MSRQLDLVVQGLLGTNPIISRTPSGRLFCYFRVATAPSFRVEGSWREGPTVWFTAKAWGHLAENFARSLHKGDPVVLVGRFSQDAWESDRGKHVTNVLTVSCGGHDLTRGESRFMRVSRAAQSARTAPSAQSMQSAPADAGPATASGAAAPTTASADDARGPDGPASAAAGVADASGMAADPLTDAHWETARDESVAPPDPVPSDPLTYTVRDEALV